ncbi:MAG TPA: DUF5985 family protein [Burkholderiales bacterium]|nr:DUF5985 family protein [Burkholderiales bacterium]
MSSIHELMQGALVLGFLAIGVIFLRFWRDGGDRFFLYFALSFFVQAANRIALALLATPTESSPWHYCVRLLAYLLIIVAIIHKNRSPKRPDA